MGAMTMAFKVRPASLLDGLKVSDKVHFAIAQEGNDFVVTAIERTAQDAALAAASTAIAGN
jgi:Cu/Ag efflux protein CusF